MTDRLLVFQGILIVVRSSHRTSQLTSNLGLERIIFKMGSIEAIQVIRASEMDQQYFAINRAIKNLL